MENDKHRTNDDRLTKFEEYFERKKRNGHQIFWLKYNPNSEYKFDLEEAREDIEWMVAEINRLREENLHYREFIDALRTQMEEEFKPHA